MASVSKRRVALPPQVLDFERVRHVVAGTVQSRTDPERSYSARFIMQVDAFDACPDCSIKGNFCIHLKALLYSMDLKTIREWILDSTTVGTEPQSESR